MSSQRNSRTIQRNVVRMARATMTIYLLIAAKYVNSVPFISYNDRFTQLPYLFLEI